MGKVMGQRNGWDCKEIKSMLGREQVADFLNRLMEVVVINNKINLVKLQITCIQAIVDRGPQVKPRSTPGAAIALEATDALPSDSRAQHTVNNK